jgi:hypothetical protein
MRNSSGPRSRSYGFVAQKRLFIASKWLKERDPSKSKAPLVGGAYGSHAMMAPPWFQHARVRRLEDAAFCAASQREAR